ncbi:MAG: tetratricopeptide repeat protein [Deltaproteobacteria bacterium]|nr:tetratricopeptide repeat protein [Deltaproteobacteria bacterium]
MTLEFANIILSSLNILIAFFGVMFVLLTIYEFKTLHGLRKDIDKLKKEFRESAHKTQMASQRVVASYGTTNVDQQIKLLLEAVNIDPYVFNGYNALGYAYLQRNEKEKAIDAFKEAVARHPKEKNGYFDLAYGYLKAGDADLAFKYLKKAVKIDPTSKEDLKFDRGPYFEELKADQRFSQLIQ